MKKLLIVLAALIMFAACDTSDDKKPLEDKKFKEVRKSGTHGGDDGEPSDPDPGD